MQQKESIQPPVTEKLATAGAWLAEKKARDVLALDLSNHNTFTEGILIATATSVRHAQGLADYVLLESKAAGYEFLRMEGYQAGEWILLDMNDMVISILLEETRALYRLEDLWKNAAVVLDTRTTATAGQ